MFRKFINRAEELTSLNRDYQSKAFSFTVIYGRRRVGKTELIHNFQQDKPHIYFLADRRGSRSNQSRFRKKAADFFDDFEPSLETFDEVFNYINTKWTSKEKLVIIIDEFSYLAQQDDSIPSVFQLIVDEILKDGPFHLILCGSSVSMMEKSTLAYSSPLYGRRTGQIKVQPILFKHIHEFFPGLSRDELVKIFGAAGGVPFYLQFFESNDTFQNNLKHNLFAKDAVLYAEGEFLLREELREPATFMNILFAISKGATRPGDIAARSFMEAKDLPYYLDTLISLGFIRKEHPVTEKTITRKTIYRIQDNFLRFWFRYVLPHKDLLEQGDYIQAIDDIEKNYNTFLGETFEQISIEMLTHLNSAGELPFRFHKIGRQWGKIPLAPKGQNDYEIDIVAVNNDTLQILCCECKWQDEKLGIDIFHRLKEKAGFVKWLSGRKEYFCLISKSGFTENLKMTAKKDGILLFTLNDYVCMGL
jgi:AAA+ ATPase superfamily predicted ATPase